LLMDPDDLARMRDREIAWTPTFAPVAWQLAHAQRLRSEPKTVAHLRNILEHHAERLRTAHALGVTILAGSDAGSPGVPHGYGLLDELELLERAGLPPAAVLHAATAAPAACLGLRDRCGRIAPGYRSRFILTRHSPLERIGNLRRARQVVFDGTAYDSPETEDTVGL
jgi:imidazolonepropionase-like amidohydrolase